ncbi:MAG TPA: SIS domain-containing protein [Candidatus Paceibacterota bacterium]|nr:SIS domain-containing protein [Candidatus Paceibacterota bacterium]
MQRGFQPKLEGEVSDFASVIVGGMGGSALPALALQSCTHTPLTVHRDYDLPDHAPKDALYVAISYSGETEETISFLDAAHNRGHQTVVITTGGTLLSKAEFLKTPRIMVPKTGLEPRDAFGFLTKALAALLKEEEVLRALDTQIIVDERSVLHLANALQDRIPLLYASTRNEAHTYIAKILLNETAKVPAFANVFPELNHNEFQGIDPKGPTDLAKDLVPVLFEDRGDHQGIRRRMKLFRELMDERGLETHALQIPEGRIEGILYIWQLFREASHTLAGSYGVEADATPLIAEFKKRL